MSDINILYAHHIDELRRLSKTRVDDFCEGICSDRQYRRYITGSQVISQRNINQFCDRLGIQQSDFYNSFYAHDNKEYVRVYMLYNELNANNFDEALKKIDELKKYKFLNIQTKKWFEYCVIKYDQLTKKISKYESIDKYSSLINYPECLSKKIFDFVDIVVLLNIAYIEYDLDQDKALVFLYESLFDRKYIYVSTNSNQILPSIYNDVSKILGMKGLIEEALDISSEGIKYSLKINEIRHLPSLYYVKAYALFKLGKVNESLCDARRCIAACITQNNDKDTEIYVGLVRKYFLVEPWDLFKPGFIKTDK